MIGVQSSTRGTALAGNRQRLLIQSIVLERRRTSATVTAPEAVRGEA